MQFLFGPELRPKRRLFLPGSDRPAPGVFMSGGKAVQEGVRVRLPGGVSWDGLAALDQVRGGAEAHGSMARFLGRDGDPIALVFRFAPAEGDEAVLGFARERIPRRAG